MMATLVYVDERPEERSSQSLRKRSLGSNDSTTLPRILSQNKSNLAEVPKANREIPVEAATARRFIDSPVPRK
jgi:hypothetical protein